MYKQVFYYKYAKDWTKEEKERQFKLIKKQIENAKSVEEVPALEVMFAFWNLYRVLKNYIEDKLNCKLDIRYDK